MPKILGSSVSLAQFILMGDAPGEASDIVDFLQKAAFVSIEGTNDETAIGWVQSDDYENASFDDLRKVSVGDYLFFSLRKDTRRVPPAVLKQAIKKAEARWLSSHTNLRRPPKAVRNEIKETVMSKLLAKCLAVPAVFDVAWDVKNKRIYVFAHASKQLDLFDTLFRKTFPGQSIKLLTPFDQCSQLLDDSGLERLKEHNQAGNDSTMSLIKDNKWLGEDLMVWLLAGCGENACDRISAWIDSRLVLEGNDGEGLQKIAVTGPLSEKMPPIRSALLDAKRPVSATLYIEDQEENTYKFTLAADTFVINGYKTPRVLSEPDDNDPENEYRAAILDKMGLIKKGLSHFHDLLAAFLEKRLASSWQPHEELVGTEE